MKTIRCSALPLGILCSGSQAPCEKPEGPAPEVVSVGNATHAVLEYVVKGDATPCVESCATPHFLSVEEELRPKMMAETLALVDKGALWWMAEGVESAETEIELSREIIPGVTLTGHPDAVWRTDVLNIWDWKTGHKLTGYEHQLMGYAWMASKGESVRLTLAALQGRKPLQETYEDVTVQEWYKHVLVRLAKSVKAGKYQYFAGDHCQICPHRPECPLRKAHTTTALTVFKELPSDLTLHERLAEIKPMRDAVNRAVKQFDALWNRTIDAGPIPDGEGMQWVNRPTSRENINMGVAFAVFAEEFERDWETIFGLTGVNKKAVEALLKKRVPRGKGAEAIREFWAEVRLAGACSYTPTRHVVKEPIEEGEE